ncbi:MAG: hypothetical protein WC471_02430 [Candidatus Woesearchaeota archaeon]
MKGIKQNEQLKYHALILFSIFLLLFELMYEGIVFKVLLVIFVLWSFYILDYKYSLDIQIRHYFVVSIMYFFGVLLSPLYIQIYMYDKILHFIMPVFGAGVIFYFVNKLNIRFGHKLAITLSFVLSAALMLELVEYWLDLFFKMDLQGVYIYDVYTQNSKMMQKGLADTMLDMAYALLGGLLYIIYKYLFRNMHKSNSNLKKK